MTRVAAVRWAIKLPNVPSTWREGCPWAMPTHRRAKPRSPEHAALGRAVEELRREAGLTQEELADRMHSEFAPVGKLERGVSNRPSLRSCDWRAA